MIIAVYRNISDFTTFLPMGEAWRVSRVLSDVSISEAIDSMNVPDILFYNSLESNPGAPHIIDEPNILIYN